MDTEKLPPVVSDVVSGVVSDVVSDVVSGVVSPVVLAVESVESVDAAGGVPGAPCDVVSVSVLEHPAAASASATTAYTPRCRRSMVISPVVGPDGSGGLLMDRR
jgi:hypothetical protein